ncbi:hypothetical protein WJX72_007381 [[Myrmecia] bisecta]|uniref:Uncharacterized protein n=1 Tax=[Myrmecia] bisecta TaxID=41462 RepID=A0AAW1PAN1_9CHLO
MFSIDFKNIHSEDRLREHLQAHNVSFQAVPHEYGGPAALAAYQAHLVFPYQPSTMSLYELLVAGIVSVLPSPDFYEHLLSTGVLEVHPFGQMDVVRHIPGWQEYMDWYHSDFEGLFVYFDSWEQLKTLQQTFDFPAQRRRVVGKMEGYSTAIVHEWARYLSTVPPARHPHQRFSDGYPHKYRIESTVADI